MKLYEINAAIEQWEPEVDEEGVVTNYDQLESLEMEKSDKLEGIALHIKNLKSDIAAIREEEKNLAARRKVMENRVASMTDFLDYALAGSKFDTPRVAISYRKSIKTIIDDAWLLARWLKRNGAADAVEQPEPKIDKNMVKTLLKEGIKVPHAKLEESTSMHIK